MTRSVADIIAALGTGIHVDGAWRDAADGKTFPVVNPATGQSVATIADGGTADADAAIETAGRVQPGWAAVPARERAEILRRAHELLVERTEELALLMTTEMGKPLGDARGEVAYGAEFFRWFSEEAVRLRGDYRVSPDGSSRIITVRQPVGPALAITPWNFPLAMGARKIAPALAAGCTIIAKPASKTPLSMLYLAKLMKDAGVPDGVVSVLPTGKSANVSALLGDPRLRKFTFTGSTEVGQMLGAKAAETSMKVSLELGGNAPFVVLEDADVDKAIAAIPSSKLRNGGQVCIAPNRFIVHESLADEFTAGVVKLFGDITVGRGTDPDTNLGPLALRSQQEKVAALVDDAVKNGGTVHIGGDIPELSDDLKDGYFYAPTVITGFDPGSDIVCEEIFGPVVAVTTVKSDEEAIAKANDTQFGLAAYVFSENLTRALGAAESIESGMVAVNKGKLSDPSAPFGGVKQSGIGREGGFSGIDEFLEEKFITLEN